MPDYIEDGKKTEPAAASDSRRKVLLIGDSIRQGYCGTVREALADIADVRFPNDNCRFTQYTYVSLGSWRWIFERPEDVEVVLWNNGHWDAAHWDGADESLNPPGLYAEMTKRIAKRLRKYFPRAKLIFATTTPMNPNGSQGANPRSNAEISRYNSAAVEALGREVIIDDLNAFCRDFGEEMYADYCHLTPEGFRLLGLHVAETIRNNL